MNFFYLQGRQFQLTTGFNWTSATIKALAVMTNSTAYLDQNATFLTGGSGFTTLDEFDGAGYSRQTLTSPLFTPDLVTLNLIFSCAVINFGNTVSNGTRQAKGFVIYLDGANDGARRPLMHIDSVSSGPPFPYSPAGGPFKLTPHLTKGLFQCRSVSNGA